VRGDIMKKPWKFDHMMSMLKIIIILIGFIFWRRCIGYILLGHMPIFLVVGFFFVTFVVQSGNDWSQNKSFHYLKNNFYNIGINLLKICIPDEVFHHLYQLVTSTAKNP
jgi:hypothetical protein